ncbi:response regulator transcription factor [Acaryochloris sp. IP29b_bin.137]|uniref:response regulator transcription factor n=1 Tax=Acaryochloris sp. IP29b_bin.137 TaxID=2969217 RepID=UPI002611C4FE|nr:response regulator transcription factor [Acaryochloris sp. IP29b_bin.137]
MPLRFLVIDDHDMTLRGTQSALQQQYPDADILVFKSAEQAYEVVQQNLLDLVVLDLSIPHKLGDPSRADTGLQLLRDLMEQYPMMNIVVLSCFTQKLVRLKPTIIAHEGGFTIVDKSVPTEKLLLKIDWALQGLMCTPKEMRTGIEIKPEWLAVLQLAFQEGLQDQAIAQRLNISLRTVRNYWTKVQDALGVYPEADKSIRIQTEIQARSMGLID